MAQQYDNTNKGALFGNTRQREGKKDPDLQGKINIDGTEHWLSAWFFTYEKDGQKKRGINLSIGDPVEEKAPQRDTRNNNPVSEIDSDIPF